MRDVVFPGLVSLFLFAFLVVLVEVLGGAEGHGLEDDAHAHDGEEVGVGGALAGVEDQVRVLQERALDECLQERELFVVENRLEEV